MSNRLTCIIPTVILLLLVACSRAPTPRTEAAASTVKGDNVIFPLNSPQRAFLTVTDVELRTIEVHRLTGRLAWDEEATVRVYTPVAGRVRSVNVALGAQVEAQAALALIDSSDFGQAQAEARKAGADLLLAERALARSTDLFEHGAAARKDLDAAENAYAGAQAEQQRSAARLTFYGASPAASVDGFFTLRTPLAGIVVEKNINRGQELRSDLMLANAPQLLAPQFTISNPRRLWVILDITELDMSLLQPGQELAVHSRAFPDHTFTGRLDSLGQSLDPATRTVKARGFVDNSALLLKAEMYVDVEIGVPETGGMTFAVASTAVFTKDGKHYVFVETAPGSFARREIEPGAEFGGKILVRRGLTPNDRILTDGSLLVEAVLEMGGQS